LYFLPVHASDPAGGRRIERAIVLGTEYAIDRLKADGRRASAVEPTVATDANVGAALTPAPLYV
jgi:hypothetical protein